MYLKHVAVANSALLKSKILNKKIIKQYGKYNTLFNVLQV